MKKLSVYFYGTLFSATKREAESAAREAGYRVASALNDSPDLVVLGEGEPLAQTRARLADEFDDVSREPFESGNLEVLSEREFFRRAAKRAAETDENGARPVESPKHTPAAVAELSGVSVATIRRWHKRGLLVPIDVASRLPLFSTREALVAKRLAFLCSTGLSEDFVAKRLFAFYEESAAAQASSLAEIVLKTTLSSDGRDVLYLGASGPIDARGQRRFDFTAFPTDGSFETPTSAQLSEEEEQIALAERLAAWNKASTDASGRPAFLDLFGEDAPTEPAELLETPDSVPTAQKIVRLCQNAWRLEREGYWEEAELVYRAAALAGGHEPDVCYRLGKLLFLLGDYSAARERFYSALELDEDYVDAKIELGKTFAALGNHVAALDYLNEALVLRPRDPALRVELGKTYLCVDRREDAEREFRAAIDVVDDAKLADDVRRLLLTLALRDK
ncbi:MAG: MerR family DNA-binding transcriptional regulator [Thermoguttaceae bacterium]|nr:MerR family DNA-binding transcriptional regulator [Thermoguttaceae bacterium]